MVEERTVVDLFCGGGGSSSGYHQAGYRTVFAVDKAEHCVNTFNANFGEVSRQGDVSALHSLDILREIGDSPFLLTASPPCEPYTAANEKRIRDPYLRMFDDPVGRLMIESIRLIADLRPRYFVIENVAGVLEGRNAELLADEFARLGLDRPYFNVVHAEEWGVPSRRKRVIISNVDLRSPRLPYVTVGEALSDLPPPNDPHGFDDHYIVLPPPKHASKVSMTGFGQGLVYFKGAKKQYKNYMRLYPDKPAEVVMGLSKFIHPYEDRLLTIREHARLMSFPDDHVLLGTTDQKYDMVGEAVPPNLTLGIARAIESLESKDT